jgi:hypothetical protein
VIVDNDLIDPANPVNKAFLAKFGGVRADVVKKVKPVEVDGDAPGMEDEPDDSDLMAVDESERRYLHFRAIRNEKAVETAELELAKRRGEVIPSELIKPLFSYHNQSILTEFKNLIDEQVRYMAKQYNIGINQVAEIKGKLNAGLNEAIARAKRSTSKGVENIVSNYAEK